MSKVEELAKKYCEGSSFEDACMEKPAYTAGYHQAEKDLKGALVAEIDRLENKLYYEPENFKDVGAKMALDSLKSSLDTLEVKEVDLEKEYKDFVEEDPVYNKLVNGIVGKAIAKHFFELGLKSQKGE